LDGNDVWTRRIAAGRQVVFYDQRGTGKSQRVAEGAAQTMAAQVGDLDAVRGQLGFDKVDLAGDSYGGLLAMAYVAAHPEHVRRLILSDSAPPAWKDMVHLLPQVFPDIEEQDAEITKKQSDPEKGGAGAADQSLPHDLLQRGFDAYVPGGNRGSGQHAEGGGCGL
jgi:proline iminopeptidase